MTAKLSREYTLNLEMACGAEGNLSCEAKILPNWWASWLSGLDGSIVSQSLRVHDVEHGGAHDGEPYKRLAFLHACIHFSVFRNNADIAPFENLIWTGSSDRRTERRADTNETGATKVNTAKLSAVPKRSQALLAR